MNIRNFPAKRTTLKLSNTDLFHGVAGGAVHDSSAQVNRPAANMDSRKGNGGSRGSRGSPYSRPSALVVKNELLAKNMREENYEDSDGSLPVTPEFPLAERDPLECATKQLLSDFFKVIAGISQSNRRKRPALTTMKRVVESLRTPLPKCAVYVAKAIEDRGADVALISEVAKFIFEDGTTNWGRVASLISFGAVVCQSLKTNRRENYVEQVGQAISSYLLSHHREWLVQNNAWDGFVQFFRVEDPESSVRNTLMAVVGFGLAGIGATLAIFINPLFI